MNSSNFHPEIAPEIAGLREVIFKAKAAKRHEMGKASIEEKFRMLEEMRDFTASTRRLREENRAKVKSAWLRP